MSNKTILASELESALDSANSARIGVCVPSNINTDSQILKTAATLAQAHGCAKIVCATKLHAATLQAALENATEMSDVEVVFMQDLALRQLECEQVQEQVKRKNRVLDANEMDVLTEDVKVCGLKAKRLSEMLKFFYHSLADCTAEKDDWLVSEEEAKVFAILEENLEARQACVPAEVAAKAYIGMKQANVEPCATHMVVDNFGALSRSAQRLLEFLSGGNLVAFGNEEFQMSDDEAYPNPAGMAEFLKSDGTTTIYVEEQTPIKMPAKTLQNPMEEFEYITTYVQKCTEDGTKPEDITIACPNATWAKQIHKALKAQNVACALDLPPKKIAGDPRDKERCGEIRLHAFAKLLQNKSDVTALRTFIGAGDWLVGSDGFLELLAYARQHNLGVQQAIKQMRSPENVENTTESFRKFLRPLGQLDFLLKFWQTQNAGPITECMYKSNMPLGRHAWTVGDCYLKPNIDAFANSFVKPTRPLPAGVVVCTFSRTLNHPCKTLVVAGMVDGFMPKRDAVDDAFDLDHRNRALARDARVLHAVERTAQKCIVYTNFDHDALENTAALHMHTTRIYQKDGRRMARVSSSALLNGENNNTCE